MRCDAAFPVAHMVCWAGLVVVVVIVDVAVVGSRIGVACSCQMVIYGRYAAKRLGGFKAAP